MGTHVMVLELTSYSSSFFWTDCVSSELLGWVGVGEALGEVLGESDTLLPSDTGATMACNRQNEKLKKWRTLTFIGHLRWILFNNFFFFKYWDYFLRLRKKNQKYEHGQKIISNYTHLNLSGSGVWIII